MRHLPKALARASVHDAIQCPKTIVNSQAMDCATFGELMRTPRMKQFLFEWSPNIIMVRHAGFSDHGSNKRKRYKRAA